MRTIILVRLPSEKDNMRCMAVLAALLKNCLADDLLRIFWNDCKNTLQQLVMSE